MKITGFSIVRNALKYDYPIVEAISSILPICDEFIVAVGNSEDETLALIQSIASPKIRIIETQWDDSLRENGKVLAVETNKAIAHISPDTTWAFYIQADEVLHEKYIPTIKEALLKFKDTVAVEGFLFKYFHFFGNYNYVGDSRKWYRNEIRVFRNTGDVVSYKDAQGFRKKNNEKLSVRPIDAYIYHYGWVRPPEKMAAKIRSIAQYWHTEQEIEALQADNQDFDYSKVDALKPFDGTHPQVFHERIARMNWQFSHDIKQKKYSFKNRLLMAIEHLTGWRIGEYRNYKIIS